ncbi:probable glycerol-3-phosphate acyltransferase 2 [Aristolochia californica]|uniref:probable glycerol-3-phosphate acyltransferase 2 n=1 Tax=Aristolochia californica TaxID=171875 RepID=UPI0035DB593D
MATSAILKFLLFFRIILRRQKNGRLLQRRGSSLSYLLKRLSPPLCTEKLPQQTLLCDVEGALFKSSSLFPYFMLLAFEAGGLLRAFLLFLLYPFMSFLSEEWALKVMVMVTFCGIREESLTVGRTVLPKFFLEDVRLEGFEVLTKAGKRVAVTEMPRVMVEVFLKEYLNVDVVVASELKIIGGYYVGLVEKKMSLDLNFMEEEKLDHDVVGMTSFKMPLDRRSLFSKCKAIYWVSEADKQNSNSLPTERYPKPLIFHDGRLAFRPTPIASLAMFMWIPFGLLLALFRLLISLSLPYSFSYPILAITGMKLRRQPHSKPIQGKSKGTLYVCNHRTLLDPIYLSFSLNKSVTAVTYSLSRVSEILSPIKTVSLTRNKEQDRNRMEGLLRQGDLLVCPEGTTCREPFLLRFSPLFAEITKEIVPVAMNTHVSMFYGTTAGGLKCLDPLFFLMNPNPGYEAELLEKMTDETESWAVDKSSIEVANMVQAKIGNVLGFECTKLTRKDKYLMLAGNEGIVGVGNGFKTK